MEPNNDFQELLDLGVLPQNIWAFEYTSKTYKTALGTYSKGQFPQPRLIKQNIETFFKYTPKKFDVVYIDACGCVPSDQHALRCLTNVCRYSRLSSPGVIITNFSSPDSEKENINEYVELVSTYLFFKKYPNDDLYLENYEIRNEDYYIFKQKVSNNFLKYYGDFISAVIRDIPSVIVPLQRLSDNPYFQQLSPEPDIKQVDFLSMLENTSGNSIGRFFVYCEYIKQAGELPKKIESFIKEVEDKEDTLKKGVMRLQQLRIGNQNEIEELQKIRQFFAGNEAIYQFLDKPHSNLIIDAIINQLVYPMHFCPWKNWRYKYCAKTRNMFTDVSVYDECRYIYEWMPAVHQQVSVLSNLSWQYVFRFAMDGLIKSRINFNNEFFYQGSVVLSNLEEFVNATLTERVDYNSL